MNLSRLTALILFILVIISCNVVSAVDLSFDGNYSQVEGDVVEIDSDNAPIKQIGEDVLEDSPDSQSSSTEDYTIYVGTNSTPDGSGTQEDPFATLELACNNYNAGEQKDTVNVMINDGTYYLGSYLKFNTNNLNIVGNGSVIIKNLYNDKQQSFGSNCNFSMSNIIFNGSDFNSPDCWDTFENAWFTPFVGDNGNVIFDNCVFADYGSSTDSDVILAYACDFDTFSGPLRLYENDNITFNCCQFIGSRGMCVAAIEYPCNLRFNYCNFGGKFSSREGFGVFKDGATIVFDSCWLGHNDGLTSTFFAMKDYYPSDSNRYNGFMYRMPFLKDSLFANRHAVLEVSENYLGDNTYEIIGKLMWIDGTDDNIDKLGPMTVYLSTDNGNIPSTATLENGAFNITYTSDSDYHEITVELDSQKIKLNNKINFTLNAPTINYGDNQNITVTFPSNVNGTVYVTVNNKTYRKYCDNQNNVTVTIDDILTKGNYPVEVSFVYKNEFDVVWHESEYIYTVEEVDNFGFNTTKLTINGLSDYEFNSTVTPNSLYIGDNATVTLSLPDGANGTVTIKVGDNEAKTFNVNETITIDGFVAGENVVNITYNGNDVYDAKSVVKNISALNKPTITIPEIDAGKATTTTITLPENATGNVTVFVDGKEYSVVPLTNGSATVTIPELPAGKHNVTISYSGDGNYSGFAQTSAVEVKEPVKPTPKPDDQKPATTKKTATKITAKKKTFKAKTKVKKYTITLKAGKKAVKKVQVILKIGKKTYKAKTNAKGKATFKIKKLTKKGKYTAKITFKGNKLYKATTKKVKITVKK